MGVQRAGGTGTRLTAAHLGELIAEVAPLVAGATVRDVQPLPPRDLLLVLDPASPAESPPRTLRLRISVDRDAPRVHVQHGRVAGRGQKSFGPFYTRLQTLLVGARVHALRQVRGDRLARLELRELADGTRGTLLAELAGRHGNLVLLDGGDRVVDMLVPPPAGRESPRLALGQPWQPPPGRAQASEPGEPDLLQLLEPLGLPADRRDREPLWDAPLSLRVEQVLGSAVAERETESERKVLLERLDRRLRKARGLVAGLDQRAAAADEADRVRQDAELLQAEVGRLRRGQESVELQDWFEEGAPPRTLALDPKRGPQENVQRLFERYKKLVRSRENLVRERALASQKVASLEELLERARAAESAPDFEALRTEAERRGLLDPPQVPAGDTRQKPPAPRKPYHVFTGSAGSEIRVGRNARDNDELTLRHARGNDLWLHTADAPGSHVVLRLERGAEPDPEELLDAAHLAVHFSPLRDARRAAVHVARRKLVHKPRGAKPGLVTLSGGRTLELRLDAERLVRLLGARGEPPPGRA